MKICYFGTYNKEWGRSRIYIKGLKENGAEVIECQSSAPGFKKYFELWSKHNKIDGYDFMIVGYPGHAVVWFAKILSNKKVIFDAGWTMEEGVLISRNQKGFLGIKGLYIKFIDWLSVKCSDIVIVESEEQRKFFEYKFGKSKKYKVVYTGADDSVFYCDSKIQKREKFTVIFRGKFLPEAGVKYVVEAAKILEEGDVDFLLVGNGFLKNDIKQQINTLKPKNLNLVSKYLSDKEMREILLSCHVSIGQLESHERLKRTIPHKCFESLALGLPYITAHTKPIEEILKDRESRIFVNPVDPKDLAEKIIFLRDNHNILEKIGKLGLEVYLQNFTPRLLAKKIINLV